jgi:inner membrane protein
MTGRTHDLAAFTALGLTAILTPLPHMSFGTLLIAVGANLAGGIAPDIDQPTAKFWNDIPAGSFLGRIIDPLMGGHRFLSHSLVGAGIFGFLFWWLLQLASHTLIVNNFIVWLSFMIGFFSHLLMDTITREGVPWFFPLPIRIGFPPIKSLRIKTGGIIEKCIIFPGLAIYNGYLYYSNYHFFLLFLKQYLH